MPVNPEQSYPESERSLPRWTRKRVVAGAVAAAGAVGLFQLDGCDWFEKSGEVRSIEPTQELADKSIDSRVNVVTLNAHQRILRQIDTVTDIINTREVDAFAFQEVFERDVESFAVRFPEWQFTFAVADSNAHILKGPMGNLTMTRQEPTDIRSPSISGSGDFEWIPRMLDGVREDIKNVPEGDLDFDELKRGKEEDRVVLFTTLQVWDADTGDERDVVFINTHLSGDRLHARQLEDLIEILEDKVGDAPAVLMGDLNGNPEEIRDALLEIGFDASLTHEPTTPDSNRQIDYTAIKPGGLLGVAKPEVLRKYRSSDHFPVAAEISTDAPHE